MAASGPPHPALAWAASGAMALTGPATGAPLVAPAGLATCATGAVHTLIELAGSQWRLGALDGAGLLGERAASFGYRRRGRVSPAGTCRLIATADGALAVNLPRADDWAALAAWLEDPSAGCGGEAASDAAWADLESRLQLRPAELLVERARLLGLAVAPVLPPPHRPPSWCRIHTRGIHVERRPEVTPLVVDLSALWAGPLASQLLAGAGARVVKVESTRRPDGARGGLRAFFDLLNGGKECVALDFASQDGRAMLARLVERADIVIESSRPRALAQLGLDAEAVVESNPGLVWVSITGYGRAEPEASWIAFGDDATAAAGLVHAMDAFANGETPLFCGDAVADPLTGIYAAVAALSAWRAGEGALLDVSLRDVAAHVLAVAPMPPGFRVCEAGASATEPSGLEWQVEVAGDRVTVAPPRARAARAAAGALGADTGTTLASLGLRC